MKKLISVCMFALVSSTLIIASAQTKPAPVPPPPTTVVVSHPAPPPLAIQAIQSVRGWDTLDITEPATSMTSCFTIVNEMWVTTGNNSVVNLTVKKEPGVVRVSGEAGKPFQFRLICQPGSTYNSTQLGSGTPVGMPRPPQAGEKAPVTGDHPEGAMWTLQIGDGKGGVAQYNFIGQGSWGNNSVTVITDPTTPPPTMAQVEKKVDDEIAKLPQRQSNIGLGFGLLWSLDPDNGRSRSGQTGYMEGYLAAFGKDSPFQLSLGANFSHLNRFKPVRNAPNQQDVGAWVDWDSTYVGAHAGINLQSQNEGPVRFNGNLRLSLGNWHFVDGSRILSQTQQMEVYAGPAETNDVFAGRAMLDAGILVLNTFYVGGTVSVTRNFVSIPTFRGPEIPGFTKGQGYITDWDAGGIIGLNF